LHRQNDLQIAIANRNRRRKRRQERQKCGIKLRGRTQFAQTSICPIPPGGELIMCPSGRDIAENKQLMLSEL